MVIYCTCRRNYRYRSVNLNMAVRFIVQFYQGRQLFKLPSWYEHPSAVQTAMISTHVNCSNCHDMNTRQLFKLPWYQHPSTVQTAMIWTPVSCSNCHDINSRQLFELPWYEYPSAVQTAMIWTPVSCSNCHDINSRHSEYKKHMFRDTRRNC